MTFKKWCLEISYHPKDGTWQPIMLAKSRCYHIGFNQNQNKKVFSGYKPCWIFTKFGTDKSYQTDVLFSKPFARYSLLNCVSKVGKQEVSSYRGQSLVNWHNWPVRTYSHAFNTMTSSFYGNYILLGYLAPSLLHAAIFIGDIYVWGLSKSVK